MEIYDFFVNINRKKKTYFFAYCIVLLLFVSFFTMTSHLNINTILTFCIILTTFLPFIIITFYNDGFQNYLFIPYIVFLLFYVTNIITSSLILGENNRDFYYYLINTSLIVAINIILVGINFQLITQRHPIKIIVSSLLIIPIGFLLAWRYNIFTEKKNINLDKIKFYEAK